MRILCRVAEFIPGDPQCKAVVPPNEEVHMEERRLGQLVESCWSCSGDQTHGSLKRSAFTVGFGMSSELSGGDVICDWRRKKRSGMTSIAPYDCG